MKPGHGEPSSPSKPASRVNVVPAAESIRKPQPRSRANGSWTSIGSGDTTTNAARFSRWALTPLKPSAQSVQYGQLVPMLWATSRSLLSPNSAESLTFSPFQAVSSWSLKSPALAWRLSSTSLFLAA